MFSCKEDDRRRRRFHHESALITLPFRIHPVQGKGHDRQHICADGSLGPGGVDFRGGYIFDVVPIFHIIILCRSVPGRTVMHYDILRNDHPAQYDLPGFIGGLDLVLRNFRGIFPVQGMGRDDKDLFSCIRWRQRTEPYILDCRDIRQDLGSGNADRLKARCPYIQRIFRDRKSVV